MTKDEFPFNEEAIALTETRTVRRLRVRNVIDEILQSFNLERGAIFTLKQLFVNPGLAVKNYIGVGRLQYTGAFKLLIITTTIAFLLLPFTATFTEFKSGFYAGVSDARILAIIEQSAKYFNLLLWLYIPVAAFFTWLINRKRLFNFAENLALHTYVFCLSNVVMLLLAFDKIANPVLVLNVVYVLFTAYYIYAYKVFFSKKWLQAIIEMFLLYLVSSIVYFILLLGLLVVYLKLFPA
jgi:hypothetical protein